MKQVIFFEEYQYRTTHFTPAAGVTTIDSDLALQLESQGILKIVGDGCGCGEKVQISEGVTMARVVNNPNRPVLPEDEDEDIEI